MRATESLLAARQRLELACAQRPGDPALVTELLSVLEQLDAYDQALGVIAAAIEHCPGDCSLLLSRARISTYLGEFVAARETYAEILQTEPGNVAALCAMVMLGHGNEIGGLAGVEARLAAADLSPRQRALLGYARARLLEEDCRFDEAFSAFREANAARAAAGGMNVAAKQRGARIVLADIDPAVIERCSGRGNRSERPVFIVGMPRSGTSLTEQVLAAHPDVYAAGERLHWGALLAGLVRSAPVGSGSMVDAIDQLHSGVWEHAGQDYLRHMAELNSVALRITDKLPANFALLPFIRLIFPRADHSCAARSLATIASCIKAPFSDPSLAFTVEDWARFTAFPGPARAVATPVGGADAGVGLRGPGL
ncbi:MAG: sulfotransferase [Halioglobus sp.]